MACVDDDPSALTVRVHRGDQEVAVRVWPVRDAGQVRPVLLACHGWTDSGEVFGPVAQALGRHWTVLAPDAPGHGATPWRPGDRYSVADQAAAVTAVIDALPRVAGRAPQVIAYGHSMGGLTAARVAAARPETVVHVVLEEPARATPRRVPSTARVLADLRRLRALDQDQRVAYVTAHQPDWPADEREPWARSKSQVDLNHLRVPTDWGEPLATTLPLVRQPVTIIHGRPSRGGIVSAPAARRCAAACPGGGEVVRLDAGHNPRREARDGFVAALLGVFDRYSR